MKSKIKLAKKHKQLSSRKDAFRVRSHVVQTGSNYPSMCMPVSGRYGGSNEVQNSGKALAFVVQSYTGVWCYVRVNPDNLDICGTEPLVFPMHCGEDMLEIWKRVVIDNAIPWNDNVRVETLRIVEVDFKVKDATLSFFNDDEEVTEFIKMSAMSKLSDQEARTIGTDHLKAKHKIIQNSEFHSDDRKILDDLVDHSGRLTLNSQLVNNLND